MKRQLLNAKRRPKLSQLQRIAAAAIMRPLTKHGSMQSHWLDGSSMAEFANTIIKPNDRCSSFERLEIYNRQYWFRVLDCLIDDFPGVRAIIGQRHFDELSEAYLQKNPSTSYSIRNLGRHLPEFIKRHPKFAGSKAKLAYDMARLEWARIVAFDGPASVGATGSEITKMSAARLKLRLQPHISLLELDYPVDEISLRLKKIEILRTEAVTAARAKQKLGKLARAAKQRRYVVVHRVDNSVYFKNLEPAQFFILAAMNSGKSIEQACAFALRKVSARDRAALSPRALQTWFGNWASFGWFCKASSQRQKK
jgi:hypothetical protein